MSTGERMPGEFPTAGYENPYRATNLDPRVDGGKVDSSAARPSSSIPSNTQSTSPGVSTSVGVTSAAPAVAASTSTDIADRTGPAPSSLSTTADPAGRSAEYSPSFETKVPASAPYATKQNESTGESQGMMGKALGALGLGGAAGAAAGYLGYGSKSAEATEPRDTPAVAVQPGVASQESGPPKHYRRESIPTTAYPGGPKSPPAVAPPVGGTAGARQSIDQSSNGPSAEPRASSDRGIGGVSSSITAAMAAGASALGFGAAKSGVSDQEYSDRSNLRDDTAAESKGPVPTSHIEESVPTSSTKTDEELARKISSPGSATADAIEAGAFPLHQTHKEAELLGNISKDPATVGGLSGTSVSSEQASQPSNVTPDATQKSQPSETVDSHTGRNVAAGGAAAAGAGAGAYGLHHHKKSDDLRSAAADNTAREPTTSSGDSTLTGGHSYTITGGDHAAPVDAISSRDPSDRKSTTQAAGATTSASPDAPIDAVAAAPGRYEGQDFDQRAASARAAPMTTVAGKKSLDREHDSHTGRDAALGAGAAAAGVGGLAYAARDQDYQGSVYDAITVPRTTADTSATSAPSYGTSTTADPTVTSTTKAPSYGTSATADPTMASTTSAPSYGPSTATGPTVASPSGTSATQPASRSYESPSETVAAKERAQEREADDHTGRNAALGAAAGAAAVGGAAYAAHDRSDERELERQREAEAKEAARREKELEKEERKHQKEVEKEEKRHQKEAEREEKKAQKEAEKEEKKHQKELEKEEKKHQKELEKEEKERAVAAAEAEKREQARLAAEEDDRKRREREVAAGVGTAAAVGGVTAAATADEEPQEERKKKPSIFKRIFKRRKNKDTGEDEDYSTDDEEDKAAHAAAAGSAVPHHHSDEKGRTVLGHGRDKDAYRNHPAWKGPVTDIAAENSMNTPGRPHPGAEERLGYEQGSTPAGTEPSAHAGGTAAVSGASAADTETRAAPETATGRTSGVDTDTLPRESITGLPYDPSKDPETARRLSSHGSGPFDTTTTSGTDPTPTTRELP